MTTLRLITLAVISFALLACSKKKEAAKSSMPSKAESVKAHEEQLKKDETEDLFRTMKSETMAFLYNFGVAIQIPKTEQNNSTEQYKVALNMGIAITDAISAVVNKNDKDFLKYAGYINEYAERLNVSEAVLNKYTMIKNAVSAGEWDKVENLLYDMEENVFAELKNNDMTQESILIMTAGWIEGLYVSSRSLQSNPNANASKALNKQNFVKYLQSNLDNLNDDLTNKAEMLAVFDALPKIEAVINQKNHVFTTKEIASIVSLTEPLHNSIVK